MGKAKKTFSRGELKRRGWSNALIKELLPQPRYVRRGSHSAALWRKEDVLRAEATERFHQASTFADGGGEGVPSPETDGALSRAAAFLEAAWDEAAPFEGAQGMLARRYHEAILRRLPAAAWADRLRPGQAIGRVEQFLALEKQHRPTGPVLKNFVTAGPWMGRNTDASLMEKLRRRYGPVLYAVAGRELEAFRNSRPEANVEAFLEGEDFPHQELINQSLGYIYSVIYVPRAIRKSLRFLAELDPKDEYPEARAMKRRFVLHIGGTNTGKTYAGFQRLIRAETGVYLAPLRLLALEAQELLLENGVACSLTTGEEEDRSPGDTHIAATAEKLEISRHYDAAVIDECQMIADPERGYAWTRAILGVLAEEVHLCAAPEAKNILLRIIQSCGDECEVIEHRRKTPLVCMDRPVDYGDIRPGDALITFSKVGVLSVAEDLRSRGKEPAIIYGALPYSTRRRQVEGFLSGDMEYVVSTDAIGMGLNLPIRRVIFMETEKFDGHERRSLKPEEIKQIAGRAGRYGMYEKGYVGAMQNLSQIKAGMDAAVPPLERAVVGFSELVVAVDFDLLEVLEVWSGLPSPAPYVKLDVSRYISLISRIRQAGFHLTKEQELRAANIPFDETDPDLSALFFRLLTRWQQMGAAAGEALPWEAEPEDAGPLPAPPEASAGEEGPGLEPPARKGKKAYTLPELELYCRKLDLYYSFSKAFDCPVDNDALYEERERVAEEINQILLHNLKNNIRFCARCGGALPLHHSGRLCNTCYRKIQTRRG